jgi:hypothetical protein
MRRAARPITRELSELCVRERACRSVRAEPRNAHRLGGATRVDPSVPIEEVAAAGL